MDNRLRNVGFVTFFLSGICAISSGVIVSILQERCGFAYGMTGTLLAIMSIGNMVASFASGILPGKIGAKQTVVILCLGYFLGYLMMAVTGLMPLLMLAFLLVGIAKGCALNNCTILVGNNSVDRTKGMSIMHACYASGALICPILISAFMHNQSMPMLVIAICGAVLWSCFLFTDFSKVSGGRSAAADNKGKKFAFLKDSRFWLITALIFCQNAAETSVTGWLVTYYRGQNILSGIFSTYTVTVMWGATLIARLLIAFVFPIKDIFKALTIMGIFCTIMYGLMILAGQPLGAIILLFLFAFSIAGVNPVAVSGVGKMMTNESMGILLPIGSIGAIVMPWIIGIIADAAGLKIAMLTNLVPCAGIAVLSCVLSRKSRKWK